MNVENGTHTARVHRIPRQILGMNARSVKENCLTSGNTLTSINSNQQLNGIRQQNNGNHGMELDDGGFWAYGNVLQSDINIVTPSTLAVSMMYPKTASSFDPNTFLKYGNTSTMCLNDPRSMAIQKSCVNKPNSLNTMLRKETQLSEFNGNFKSSGKFNSNKMLKNITSRQRESLNITSDSDSSFSEYDVPDVPLIFKDTTRPSQFAELTRMAMHGCDLAERLANSHRNRPCFKKIDSLCARMKQDLVRPDNVLANINSQGIAWAVKDFIFVFTRVINAWIIIKGYVYNTPDGLSKVKATLSDEFQESFSNWEESTLKFVNAIISSFVNLDELVQSQRIAFQKFDSNSHSNYKSAKHQSNLENTMKDRINSFESLDDLFMNPNACSSNNQSNESIFVNSIVENSEETQRDSAEKGTYIKTGLYNPLPKENKPLDNRKIRFDTKSIFTNTTTTTTTPSSSSSLNMENNCNNFDFVDMPKYQNRNDFNNPMPANENVLNKFIFDLLPKFYQNEKHSINGNNNGQTINCIDMNEKIDYILNRVANINEAQYFFNLQFVDNYFPEFRNIVPYCIDIRSIILKAQIGSYNTMDEVVHDLRQIVYCAKVYMQKKPHAFLQSVILGFQRELEIILTEKEFSSCDFRHISGSPNEKF